MPSDRTVSCGAGPGVAERPRRVVLASPHDTSISCGELRGAVTIGDVRVEASPVIPAGPGVVALAVTPPLRLTAEHIAALPDLRVVVATSAGFDHVDVTAAARAGIPVAHTPGYCDVEVADHVIASVAVLLRVPHLADRAVRGGVWSARTSGARRITGSTLGVVGLGRIGGLVVARARGLGMRVLGHTPRLGPERVSALRDLGAEPRTDLDDLLAASDVVTLHVPLTDETRHLMNAARLRRMRPGAALVNTGRGELVDLAALSAALHDGHLSGAALDVLDQEPPPPAHPALALPRTLVTPHMAWYSPDAEYAAYRQAGRAITAALNGDPLPDPVPVPA